MQSKQDLKPFKIIRQQHATIPSDLATALKNPFKLIDHAKEAKRIDGYLDEGIPYISDHALVTYPEESCITWNTLQRATVSFKDDKETGKRIRDRTNNGYDMAESAIQYNSRERDVFQYLGQKIRSSKTPIRFACLQEITSDLKNEKSEAMGGLSQAEIETEVNKFGFTHIAQPYGGKKLEKLVIAYDSKRIKFVKNCEIKSISKQTRDEGRMQAVMFEDIATKKSFVVINVHFGWAHINVNRPGTHPKDAKLPEVVRALEAKAAEAIQAEKKAIDIPAFKSAEIERINAIAEYNASLESANPPPGINDPKNALEEFKDMPVFMMGDFNKSHIRLTAETGRMVMGINANLKDMDELDSCDHLIVNEEG